jgi:hypothetical protein
MLNQNIGAGTIVEMTKKHVIEAINSMGHQQDVDNADSLGIRKAAQQCCQICQCNNLTKDIYGF